MNSITNRIRKEQLFKNRVTQNTDQLSKMDEQKYIKLLSEEEGKNAVIETISQSKKCKEKETVIKTLESQVQERREKLSKSIEEERAYADYVRKSVTIANKDAFEKTKQQKEKESLYGKILLKQIEEQQRLKKFKGVMTDHEMRVNKKDIDAYQKCSDEINCKIPGLSNVASKYSIVSHNSIDKSRQDDSKPNEKKNNFYETENQQYMNPNIISIAFHKTKSEGNSPTKIRNYTKLAQNSRLVQKAEENQLDPLLEQKRNPTLNKEYGYYARVKDRKSDASNSMLANAGQQLMNKSSSPGQDMSLNLRANSMLLQKPS